MRIKRLIFFLCLFLFMVSNYKIYGQKIGIETNALYLATSTPNIGLTFRLSNHSSLSLLGGYNPWEFNSNRTNSLDNKIKPKIKHWLVKPEYKYWFCKTYEQFYLGIHALYGDYDIEGISLLSKNLKNARYDGYTVGGGLSMGYQWALGKHWGLETSVGFGYLYLKFSKYEAGSLGKELVEKVKNYVGPTGAAISFIYYFN